MLSRAYTTAFEALAESGWATGAFASTLAAAAGSGLEQGFARYDDDWTAVAHRPRPPPRPLAARRPPRRRDRRPLRRLGRGAARAPGPRGPARRRRRPRCRRRHPRRRPARRRRRRRGGYPRPRRPSRGAEAAPARRRRPRAPRRPAPRQRGRRRRGPGPHRRRRLDARSAAAGIGPLEQSEGVSLTGYTHEVARKSLSCALLGPDGRGWLLGVRNSGYKVVVHPSGEASCTMLITDSARPYRLCADHPEVLDQARSLLVTDRAALASLCGALRGLAAMTRSPSPRCRSSSTAC
ncbi:MAG: hypothetical protein R3F59_02740 [Myxococcota bacterium]